MARVVVATMTITKINWTRTRTRTSTISLLITVPVVCLDARPACLEAGRFGGTATPHDSYKKMPSLSLFAAAFRVRKVVTGKV